MSCASWAVGCVPYVRDRHQHVGIQHIKYRANGPNCRPASARLCRRPVCRRSPRPVCARRSRPRYTCAPAPPGTLAMIHEGSELGVRANGQKARSAGEAGASQLRVPRVQSAAHGKRRRGHVAMRARGWSHACAPAPPYTCSTPRPAPFMGPPAPRRATIRSPPPRADARISSAGLAACAGVLLIQALLVFPSALKHMPCSVSHTGWSPGHCGRRGGRGGSSGAG